MTKIFISYRRDDSIAYVGRMRDYLEKVYDKSEIFQDISYLKGGDDYATIIKNTINKCECCIVVIGPDWHKVKKNGKLRINDPDDFLQMEISLALKYNKKIVPVLVGNAKMPDKKELIPPLKGITKFTAIDLSNERFSFDMKSLISSIGGAFGTIRFFIHKSLKRIPGVKIGLIVHSIILDGCHMGKVTGPIQVKEGIHKIKITEGVPKGYPHRTSNEFRFRIKGGQNIKLFLAENYPKNPFPGVKKSQFYIGIYKPIAEI